MARRSSLREFQENPRDPSIPSLKKGEQYKLDSEGKLQAIRLSTRPDCITEKNLDFLWSMGVRTIELGAQSFDDAVLRQAERGHTGADICRGAERIRRQGFQLGIQLMPGLPGDTEETMRYSLAQTLQLQPR